MSQYDDPSVVSFENARGRDWQEHEDEYLLEYGARATAEWANRSLASCRSRLQRLRSTGSDGEAYGHYEIDSDPASQYTQGKSSLPSVTGIVGVQAGEKPDIDAIKSKHRQTYRRTAETAQRKLFQQVNISHAPALIAFVADVHLGSPGTNIERVYEEQDLINNTPGAYTFLLGDIADSFLVGRLKDINTTHDITIPEEWYLVEDYFARWKNLIGVVGGNHDAWSHSLVGMDLHRKLIADGKVLYDTDDMRVTVNVGPYPIKFRLRHQFLGRSQYNVSHAAEKSIKFDDPWPDILVSGHTHTGALARELSHAGKRKIAIQLGSYKAVDEFAIRLGFPQTDNSTAAAVIVMPDGSYMATGSLKAACQYMRTVYDKAA